MSWNDGALNQANWNETLARMHATQQQQNEDEEDGRAHTDICMGVGAAAARGTIFIENQSDLDDDDDDERDEVERARAAHGDESDGVEHLDDEEEQRASNEDEEKSSPRKNKSNSRATGLARRGSTQMGATCNWLTIGANWPPPCLAIVEIQNMCIHHFLTLPSSSGHGATVWKRALMIIDKLKSSIWKDG